MNRCASLRRAGALVAALAAAALAACGPAGARPAAGSLTADQKPHVSIEATYGETTVDLVRRVRVWLLRSDGWTPCPELAASAGPPPECWVRVTLNGEQIAILYPEPDGWLGPFPIPLHPEIFQLKPGAYRLQLVQEGSLEVRLTTPQTITVRDVTPTPSPTPTTAPTPTPGPSPATTSSR
ncbi:MAG: hypothetical protein FJ029_00715 [Actinobacteria bacterium]|nr:hypothetical protein [Actinomycetota bacterium]